MSELSVASPAAPVGSEAESLPPALAGALTEEQRQAVFEAPREKRLEVLAGALARPEPEVLARLAAAAGLDVASNLETDPEARGLLPPRLVHEYQIIPIRLGAPGSAPPVAVPPSAQPLHIAAAWLPNPTMADWLRTFTPRPMVWHLAVPERVHQLIIENFGVGSGSLDDSDESYVAPEAQKEAEEVVDEDAAVVRFVTDVISQAIADQATDIHFEPQEGQLRIRYRVDGLLVPVPVPENLLRFQDAIISRLKIMARMNISEKRLPQDGRINFKAAGVVLDIRVSTVPTIYAESISLRLLNQKKEAYSMDRLGMSAAEQGQITSILDYPHGIILVTGPTGSGKSTSLNAFLRKINSTDLRIITIEDPIEYEVPGAAGDRAHVRRCVAPCAPAGSGCDHGGRDSRQGHRGDRDPRVADRASGLLDTAHQRCAGGDHAPRRHGDRALPGGVGDRAGHRPAPRAPPVHGMRAAGADCAREAAGEPGDPRLRCGGSGGHRTAEGPGGLRPLPRHGLSRAHRDLRDFPAKRRDAPARAAAGEHADAGGLRAQARHAHTGSERLGKGEEWLHDLR
jgi:hypothetical protein